jgi:acetyl esterase
MTRIPRERSIGKKSLQRKVNLYRRLGSLFGRRTLGLAGPLQGTEVSLETPAGRVRVLAYNLNRPERLPLFINLHGGGFVMCGPEMDDRFLGRVAQEADVKILSVDYSLAPEAPFPQALKECYEVARYAREHADELGLDPERIAIGGHSAGGNLSAAVCLLDGERRELALKALILDYAPLDLHTDPYAKPRPRKALSPRMCRVFDQAYAGDRRAALNPLISPVYASDDELRLFPPTLVITASEDSLAPEAELFKDRLLAAGVPVTFRRFEGAAHGFTHAGGPQAEEAWQMMIDHLLRHLQAPRPPA